LTIRDCLKLRMKPHPPRAHDWTICRNWSSGVWVCVWGGVGGSSPTDPMEAL
jgi:hypothetical protein